MIYQNRSVIASKRNTHGVNVFIPERMKLAGQRYVVPFKMSGIRIVPSHPTIFSMMHQMDITLTFTGFTISISDPFTISTLRSALEYMQMAYKRKRSNQIALSRDEYAKHIK